MAWTEFLLKKLGILSTDIIISKTLPKVELIDENGKSATIEKIAADDELKITNEGEKPGALGNGLVFDGTDERITVADDITLDLDNTDPFSIHAWVWNDNTDTENVLGKEDAGLLNTWVIYKFSSRYYFYLRGNGADRLVGYAPGMSTGAWQEILFTYDGSQDISGVNFYIDGSPVAIIQVTNTLASTLLNNEPLLIAKNSAGLGIPHFTGKLDEIAIWKRELTSDDASDLYATGAGLFIDKDVNFSTSGTSMGLNLQALWHLDESTGASAADSSANTNTGTLENMENADWITGKVPTISTDVIRNMISSEKSVVAGEGPITHVGDKTNADGPVKLQGNKIVLPADGRKLFFGAGEDASLNYDGSDFDMDVSEVAPSDLKLTCGASKTLELQNVVYNDLYLPIISAKQPAANFPTWAVFDTNLKAYTFALNDYVDLSTAEVLHDYKEATDITVHVHIVTNGANDGTERKVKYIAYYSWGDLNEVMPAEANVSAEQTIIASEADKTHHVLTLGTITGTGYKIGSIIKMRIKRIAGTGVEPANDPFVEMVGVHYQINTIGSRQELIK